jgi:hypothetical protein
VTLAAAARYAWASPVTALGLIGVGIARLGGGSVRIRDGVIEATGGPVAHLLPRLGAGVAPVAMALGHVVLAVDDDTLATFRDHELVHVRQAERWGVLFPVMYLAASLEAALHGKHVYRDNRFEVEARRIGGPDGRD